MHWLALGVTWLVALAIIAIGTQYAATPRAAARSFGLPLPEAGPNIEWWLRLKGVRDIASGLLVIALIIWAGPHTAGIALLVAALIPVGDMSVILAARGSTARALGIHGLTASLMILAAIALISGVA